MAKTKTKRAKSVNRSITDKPKRKAPRTAWKPGQSGNPAGAPKRGQSWKEIVREVGDMTESQVRALAETVADRLKGLGDGVTLKQAAVLSAFVGTINDPDARILAVLMDRDEGKVPAGLELTGKNGGPVELSDFRARLLSKLSKVAPPGPEGAVPGEPE